MSPFVRLRDQSSAGIRAIIALLLLSFPLSMRIQFEHLEPHHIIPTDQTFSLPDADRIVWPVARLSRLQVWCQQRTAEYLLWPQWSGMPRLRALTGELSSRARYWGKEQVPGTHSWLVWRSKITSCLERGGRISEDISLYFKFSGAFFSFLESCF